MDCVLSTSLRSTVTVAGAVYCKLADRELDAPALAPAALLPNFGMPVVAWAVLPVVGVAVVVVAAVVAVAAAAASLQLHPSAT